MERVDYSSATDVQHLPTHVRRRRFLGGYRYADVDAAIHELEWTNLQLAGELRITEARATELEAELRATRAEMGRYETAEARCRELKADLRSARADCSRLEAVEGRCRELEAELRSTGREVQRYRTMEYSIGAALVAACQRATEIEQAAQAKARALLAEVHDECARLREAPFELTPATRRSVQDGRRNGGLVGSLRGALESFMGRVDGRVHTGAMRPRSEPPTMLPAASVRWDGRSRDST
jgi:hypothetical protein